MIDWYMKWTDYKVKRRCYVRIAIIFYWFKEVIFAPIIIMVEFSDLFDNEDDVFHKKAKVCVSSIICQPICLCPPTQQADACPPVHPFTVMLECAVSASYHIFPNNQMEKVWSKAKWSGTMGITHQTKALLWCKRKGGSHQISRFIFKVPNCLECSLRFLLLTLRVCLIVTVRRRDLENVHEGGPQRTSVIHYAPPQGLRNLKAFCKYKSTRSLYQSKSHRHQTISRQKPHVVSHGGVADLLTVLWHSVFFT